MLAELSVQELLEETAAATPLPGGGSMAALAGAVAASLTEMVANLTVGKKGYESAAEEMKTLAAEAAEARKKMIAAMDRDAEAYQRVVAAFGLPKGNDAEKAIRTGAIQDALKSASMAPLEAARESMAIMESAGRVLAKGNRNAYSDAAVAVMCARTAVLGAISNVRINLAGITDEAFAKELNEQIEAFREKACNLEGTLLS